jgi:hypothetical protein
VLARNPEQEPTRLHALAHRGARLLSLAGGRDHPELHRFTLWQRPTFVQAHTPATPLDKYGLPDTLDRMRKYGRKKKGATSSKFRGPVEPAIRRAGVEKLQLSRELNIGTSTIWRACCGLPIKPECADGLCKRFPELDWESLVRGLDHKPEAQSVAEAS